MLRAQVFIVGAKYIMEKIIKDKKTCIIMKIIIKGLLLTKIRTFNQRAGGMY